MNHYVDERGLVHRGAHRGTNPIGNGFVIAMYCGDAFAVSNDRTDFKKCDAAADQMLTCLGCVAKGA